MRNPVTKQGKPSQMSNNLHKSKWDRKFVWDEKIFNKDNFIYTQLVRKSTIDKCKRE